MPRDRPLDHSGSADEARAAPGGKMADRLRAVDRRDAREGAAAADPGRMDALPRGDPRRYLAPVLAKYPGRNESPAAQRRDARDGAPAVDSRGLGDRAPRPLMRDGGRLVPHSAEARRRLEAIRQDPLYGYFTRTPQGARGHQRGSATSRDRGLSREADRPGRPPDRQWKTVAEETGLAENWSSFEEAKKELPRLPEGYVYHHVVEQCQALIFWITGSGALPV